MQSILRTSLAALFAVLIVGLTQFDVKAQEAIKRSFDVNPGGTLVLDIDQGTIRVEPSSDRKVSVEMIRRVKGASDQKVKEILSRHDYVIETRGNKVVVDSRFDRDSDGDGAWKRWKNDSNFSLEVTVLVPRTFDVEFTTGAGNISIADLEGTVRGRTGAGNIVLGEINGSIEISSGAGNIDVAGARGMIYAESGAGNITLENVQGKINVGTGAGNVIASITKSLSGDSELSSGAGNVTVYLDRSVGARVDGQASIGSAKTDFNLKVQGKWMSKSFEGSVNGGGPSLSIHSGVGNVSLKKNN